MEKARQNFKNTEYDITHKIYVIYLRITKKYKQNVVTKYKNSTNYQKVRKVMVTK